MGCDDLADTVGIDQANVKGKRNQMLAENDGLKEEIGWDKDPGAKEGKKAQESHAGALTSGAAGFEDVTGTKMEKPLVIESWTGWS
jgi:hypothetical protein